MNVLQNDNLQIHIPISQISLKYFLPSKLRREELHESSREIMRKIFAVCGFFVAFATVMTVLILYMNNAAMKHYQFTMSLNKDMELNGIAQDDPQLIMYLREVAILPAVEPHQKQLEFQEPISDEMEYVLKLLNYKKNGIFVEAGAYKDGKTSKTALLEKKYNWSGLLIQPDPKDYFNLRRQHRINSHCILACLSPMPYPREITLHNENEVKISSIYSSDSNSIENPDWLVVRVKCFPLYSLILGMNYTSVDFLSIESGGTELQILETVPFNKIKIKIIVVEVKENDVDAETIVKFLNIKNYKLMDKITRTSYIFLLNN